MDESQSRVGFLPSWPGLCEACMRVLLPLLWEYTCVSKLYIKKGFEFTLFLFCLFPPQTLEEPPYLTVGTDVSAKYRGAFCEAKIKTAKRLVKAKVSHISKWSWSKIKNVLSGCVVCVWSGLQRGWGLLSLCEGSTVKIMQLCFNVHPAVGLEMARLKRRNIPSEIRGPVTKTSGLLVLS